MAARKPNTEKKGEILDLRNQLRDPAFDKDPQRRREQLKRVIAFMTLGVDTSPLFTEMIMACITKDIVQKKMIYFYLTVHSESNSEIAILAINTLQKDCKDESPLIRGLALRSLASLRLSQLAEYLVPTLKQCLTDSSPYVRKTAIIATLKLFRIAPDTFRQMGLNDKMLGMLRDNDVTVAMNALAVLQEVTREDGGFTITRNILIYLLNRLRDLSEWQQPQVLELVLKYTPQNEEEMFDIMNLIEERLRGSNSAVILACSHVFLHLTQNLPAVHKQVFDRLREPLLTLMSTSNCIETSYAVLCHIRLLAQRNAATFASSYKEFYVRHTDPSYVRTVKIEILALITSEANWSDVVSELSVYVSDGNPNVARLVIAAMCRIALRLENAATPVLNHFLEFLTLDLEHVRGKTLACMKDFLRRYKSVTMVKPFLDCVVKSYSDMAFEDEESRLALVWVLGEFGEHIDDAPYLIETMAADFNGEAAALRTEILTTMMKLFFKRPPEMQPILGSIFNQAINDFSHADVHDRALFYFRLLKLNPKAAHDVVCGTKEAVKTFFEENDSDTRDKLFEEFNSMSVVYNIPSAVFQKGAIEDEDEDSDEDEEEEVEEDEDDDHEGGLLQGSADAGGARPSGAGASSASASKALALSEDADIESPVFQKKWGRLETTEVIPLRFKSIPSMDTLEEKLEAFNIFAMAQGQQGGTTKVYLFAQPANDTEAHFLIELLIQATAAGQATIKTDDKRGKEFAAVFKKAISAFCS